MVPVFKKIGENSAAKNYYHVSLLSAVSKVFEKLVTDRVAGDGKKHGPFL